MTDHATGQVGSDAADYYETHFVPALFRERTKSLLDLAELNSPGTVLDVGCGTGVLARDALHRMSGEGRVTGIDRNEGMIAAAERSPRRSCSSLSRLKALHTPLSPISALLLLASLMATAPAAAREEALNDWENRYRDSAVSARNANCLLCHLSPAGGSPWNAYGWDVHNALTDPACGELNAEGKVGNPAAFACVEPKDSDQGPGKTDNLTEIRAGSQPGWTPGANNAIWSRTGEATPGQLAPQNIGPLDLGGSEPLPTRFIGSAPATASGSGTRLEDTNVIFVQAGESIQAAINVAAPGTTILIEPGIYREASNADGSNALEISKSHIRLVGLSEPMELDQSAAEQARGDANGKPNRVILRNAGGQRNGIVVVPGDRTECMDCHTSLAPPFPVLPGVEPITETDPVLFDVEISGINIEGFPNNGLFTERLDGFRFVDVWSLNNNNYGIFPTLSKNGVVTRSRATGANDSGIWVETSDNIQVTHSLMEDNVNGLEISNSDDIYAAYNEIRNNTVGVAVFVLQDALFAIRPDANRYTLKRNWIHDNNRRNTATGGILATATPGTGILATGMDESRFVQNRIENHNAFGLVLSDSCLPLKGTDYDCETSPTPEGFGGETGQHIIEHNRVIGNVFVNNGNKPLPGGPWVGLEADIVFGSEGAAQTNCFADNRYTTMKLLGKPPAKNVPRPAPLPPAPCE